MKVSAVTTAILAIFFLGSITVRDGQAASESRPLEASPDNWIALGEGVGFLIVHESDAGGVPTLSGYFLAKHDGAWKRLDGEGGFRVIPIREPR